MLRHVSPDVARSFVTLVEMVSQHPLERHALTIHCQLSGEPLNPGFEIIIHCRNL